MSLLRVVILFGMAMFACSHPTGVDLRIELGDRAITKLHLMALDKDSIIEPTQRLRIDVPPSWIDTEVKLTIYGLNTQRARIAGASVMVKVTDGELVPVTAKLGDLACGSWCTVGSTRCDGKGVSTCIMEDGCTVWGAPEACPGDMPNCSLGRCMAGCVEECAAGETRCAGRERTEICGQGDDDACLDWIAGPVCSNGSTCSLGECSAGCRNECERGARRCDGTGYATCDDWNLDGCLEWGPVVSCGAGSCEAGKCVGRCQDECTMATCENNEYRTCGEFDLDACKDWSRGTPCASSDACKIGTCTATGCKLEPRVCSAPEAATCVDERTLRTFAPVGTCSNGACSYAPTDTQCRFGCQGGACRTEACTESCSDLNFSSGLPENVVMLADGKHVYVSGFALYRYAIDDGVVGPREEFAPNGNLAAIADLGAKVAWVNRDGALWVKSKTGAAGPASWGIIAEARQLVGHGGELWVATKSEIRTSNASGSRAVVSGQGSLGALAVTEAGLFWTDTSTGTVWRAGRDGSNKQRLVAGLTGVTMVTADATKLWIGHENGLLVYTLADGSKREVPTVQPTSMVADGELVCFANLQPNASTAHCLNKRTFELTSLGTQRLIFDVALDAKRAYFAWHQITGKSRCGCEL